MGRVRSTCWSGPVLKAARMKLEIRKIRVGSWGGEEFDICVLQHMKYCTAGLQHGWGRGAQAAGARGACATLEGTRLITRVCNG